MVNPRSVCGRAAIGQSCSAISDRSAKSVPDDANDPGAVLLGLLVAIASPQICDALGISPWRCLARAALSLRWFVA